MTEKKEYRVSFSPRVFNVTRCLGPH